MKLAVAICCCIFFTGCMGIGVSQIGMKILEDQIETEAAVLSLAAEFYQDEQFIYVRTPVQTFREIHPGAALIVGEVPVDSANRFYPLGEVSEKEVWLCLDKSRTNRYVNWECIDSLPDQVEVMTRPEKWFEDFPERDYLERGQVVVLDRQDNNSTWCNIGAVSCMARRNGRLKGFLFRA